MTITQRVDVQGEDRGEVLYGEANWACRARPVAGAEFYSSRDAYHAKWIGKLARKNGQLSSGFSQQTYTEFHSYPTRSARVVKRSKEQIYPLAERQRREAAWRRQNAAVRFVACDQAWPPALIGYTDCLI